MKAFLKSLVAVAAITTAASSAQAAKILQDSELFNTPSMQLVNNPGGYTLSSIGSQVMITVLTNPSTNSTGFGAAAFNFSATGTGFATNESADSWVQSLDGGSLSFTALSNFTIGAQTLLAGANILTLSFTGGFLDVTIPGSTGDTQVTIPGSGFFNVSSDFLDFPPVLMEGFSIALSGTNFDKFVVPQDVEQPFRISDFRANAVGTFNATVPEPASWAMMIAGLGLVGLSRRRQRGTTVAA